MREVGVQWDSTSVIYRFREGLCPARREVLYNIIIEFGIPMILLRLIKMCLNETYSKAHIGRKYMSD
jgi:hypothetical protein